jgi:glycosyltransferase involved in cell wall biosynthesis
VSEPLRKRWLTAIPLRYREDGAFWDRDNGLLTLGMLKNGVDSKFVALGKPEVKKDLPLILGELEQWHQPAWWKQWGADGVMFNSWGAPRYEPIARAIKASGARLVIRLDTDGFKSPRTHFFRYLKNNYIFANDYGPRPAILYAIAKTLYFRFFSAAYDRPTVRHLEHADAIIVESPLAQAILARYLRGVARPDLAAKLRTVAHPIKDDYCYDPAVVRHPRVLSVGRYNVYVKDPPLLMRILERTLPHNPDYAATIIGPGMESVQRWHALLSDAVRSRVTIAGRIEHEQLKRHYQEAQIVIFTSRSEGFPVAGEEAMSCGCSVVGPGTLPAFHYMTSESSGTCSIRMEMWRRGFRDPKRISDLWRPRVSASAVAAQVVNL